MVYYRKYRPQTIEELDLGKVRERLAAILSKETPHAFLFTGPKGLGKTSSARILAKAINCEKRSEKSIEPCNKCDACKSITNGSNIDVIEIDAASNRGIDEIRDLREKVKFLPSTLPKKVYIIDEVHMLTNDAFNALLKTLEEPPSHVVFILCTTELWKVPPTIASRTFHIPFEKPTKEELVRSMERIVKGEKIKIKKEVLGKVYKLSGGSFRDAAKILEELSLAGGVEEITLEVLDKVYKTESIEGEVLKLVNCLAKRQTKEALEIIEEFNKKGIDFELVNEKIVEVLHRLLLKKNGFPEEIEDVLNLEIEDLKVLVSYFNESYKDIKASVLPQLPLELSVINFCLTETNEASFVSESSTKKDAVIEVKTETVQEAKEVGVEEAPKKEAQHGDLFKPAIVSENFFKALLDTVKKDNHSIAGILRGCKLASFGEEEVRFETKYKFHKDKLSEDKVLKILEQRAGELLKRNVRIFVELKK